MCVCVVAKKSLDSNIIRSDEKMCVCVSVQWMRIGPRQTLSCVKDVLPPKMCVQCIVLVRFPVSYPVCNSPSFVLPGVSKCCVSPNCELPLLTTPSSSTVCCVKYTLCHGGQGNKGRHSLKLRYTGTLSFNDWFGRREWMPYCWPTIQFAGRELLLWSQFRDMYLGIPRPQAIARKYGTSFTAQCQVQEPSQSPTNSQVTTKNYQLDPTNGQV